MTKTDRYIHNICIASIKRGTIKPYEFKWTNFYESNASFQNSALQLALAENELTICSTIIDKDNFSILTTRRLFTNLNGQLSTENIQGATAQLYGDFKSYKDKDFTFGKVQLQNGNDIKYFIETGKASMIMVQGVRTLIGITQVTSIQVEGMTRIWNEQNRK